MPSDDGMHPPGHPTGSPGAQPLPGHTVSDELERWLDSDGDKTLGSIIALFEEKSFALLFIVLLGVSALPLPTGGATHVFEIVAMLLAAQLIAGRHEVWLPERWRRLPLAGPNRQRFINRLMKTIRWLERFSRPRASYLFDHRLSNIVFGVLVLVARSRRFSSRRSRASTRSRRLALYSCRSGSCSRTRATIGLLDGSQSPGAILRS